MNKPTNLPSHYAALACAVAAVLSGMSALAAEIPIAPVVDVPQLARPQKPQQRTRSVANVKAAAPEIELTSKAAVSNTGFDTKSAFTAAVPSPDSQTLSAPVTITYSGGSPVLLVNDTGTNKGVESVINNTHNSTSALYGVTNGSGAGLTGYNSGMSGPAGKFGILNSNSSQPAIMATTNAGGSAVYAISTASNEYEATILAVNNNTNGYGIGMRTFADGTAVEGFGGYTGVYGDGTDYGAWGQSSSGIGVYGQSSSGMGLYGSSDSYYGINGYSDSSVGVYGQSTESFGVYANSYSGTALYATTTTGPYGIEAVSSGKTAIFGYSTNNGYGVRGQSTDAFAVIGEDLGSGTGVYGSSATGYAGYFHGKVAATSYVTLSDRNAKTRIKSVDGREILSRIDQLSVESWVFKTDLERKHVGPMAQDFHAAFGLDGQDDKHINLTDIAGVSLAAIKELSVEMKKKDAEIASLRAQLKSMEENFSARMTALEVEQQRVAVVTQTAYR